MFVKALHHASSIRLKAAHPHCVSWISHLRSMLFDVQSILNSMISLWDHQRLRVCKYENTYLCFSYHVFGFVCHFYARSKRITMKKIIILCCHCSECMKRCSVQLFRGIRRCSFKLMTCMNSQSCGADLSQPSGKLIVVPSVFLPRCQVSKSSILSPSLPVLQHHSLKSKPLGPL